jgi:ribosome maturation factor RimP
MNFLPEHIETRLRDEIAHRGMVLLDLKRRGERGTTVIEVVVDSEEGVKLDDLTELSRWTAALFDEAEEAIPGRYRLEVSSAGLDRPLEHLWQYRKNLGRLIKLTFDDDSGTRKTELFRLIDLHDDMLTVAPSKKPKKGDEVHLVIPLARVTRATVEPQF